MNLTSYKPNEFPSDLVEPSEKLSGKWMLAQAQTYHYKFNRYGPTVFRNRLSEMFEWRRYGKGKQDINKYKQRLGVRDEQGKDSKSWRNIDWSVLEIAPRFKRVILGKIINGMGKIKVKAIDPLSVNSEREYKANLQEFVINQALLQEISSINGAEFASPVDEGVPMPKTMDDVEIHMGMYFKDRLSMELQDGIELSLANNNWKALAQDLVEDLVEVGYAGTRTWIDEANNLRLRKVIPERVGVWGAKFKDFRDAKSVWEYVDITIGEFIEQTAHEGMTRDEASKLFDEATYFSEYNNRGTHGSADGYSDNENREDRATFMDLRFTSIDTHVYQTGKNKFGNDTISQKPLSFYKPHKANAYDNDNDKKVITKEIMNVYECKWLVGTEFVWDVRLANNMERDARNMANTKLGYTLYNTDDSSVMSQLVPIFDSIQVNWLQYQTHLNKTKPAGIEIEMSAFEDLNLGKGMESMNAKDVIKMFYDTGNIVWRRKDWSGRDINWKPITESKAILPEGAYQHLDIIMQLINYLRDVSGLNEVVDGSTPRPDIGKAVSEIAAENSNNALQYLFYGFDHIYEGTAKTIANLIPIQVKNGPVKGMIESLGLNSVKFFELNSDIQYRNFGITIEHKPTDTERAVLNNYVNIALQNQEIGSEDAFMITREDNLLRAAQLLALKRKQKMMEGQQIKKDEVDMLSQQQQESNAQTAENEIKKLEQQFKMEVEKEKMLSDLRVREDRDKIRNQLLLEKFKSGQEMDKTEKELLNKLVISRESNETDLVQTQILAKAQQQKPANQANTATKQAKNKAISNTQ